MNRVKSYSITTYKSSVVALLIAAASLAWGDDPAGQLIDSPYDALEARSVEMVVNAAGDVVGIRGKGCPGCPSSTILPARDLVVEAGRGVQLEGQEVLELNGRPGVIQIYRPTGLAHRVSFPGVTLSGGEEQ